ncbi:MAG: DUF5104 domain-containing protein [Clostridia bacterium]|nr:DUF5104 domain-containing protein [Clostridia bacterium]
MEKLISLFLSLVLVWFNTFPGSGVANFLYGNLLFDWESVAITPMVEAIKKEDAEAVAEMASPTLKKEYPDLQERIMAIFDDVKGETTETSVTFSRLVTMDRSEYFDGYIEIGIKTTENRYIIQYIWRGLDRETKQKETGIRRISLTVTTDENGSLSVIPKHYIAVKSLNETTFNMTRMWVCAQGNCADNQTFMVNDGGDNTDWNIEIRASRNSGGNEKNYGHAFGLNGEHLKIYIIPEGEDPPESGTRKPDMIADNKNMYIKYIDVPEGNYYLYCEPSNPDMLYTIYVTTKI